MLVHFARYGTERDLIEEAQAISMVTNNSLMDVMSWPSSWRRQVWDIRNELVEKSRNK